MVNNMFCLSLLSDIPVLGWGTKATETNLLEERKHLKQDKQALEVDLAQMKKERDLARAQIVSASGNILF